MKEAELRAHATCNLCGKKVLHTGLPLFWRVKIERFGINKPAVDRLQGMTMFFGGNAGLASVMGADEDLASPVMDAKTITVCEDCATGKALPIAALPEMST